MSTRQQITIVLVPAYSNTWSPYPPSHLNLLDKILDRAKRLIQRSQTSEQLTTLQSHQDNAMFLRRKLHKQLTPHLRSLLQQPSHAHDWPKMRKYAGVSLFKDWDVSAIVPAEGQPSVEHLGGDNNSRSNKVNSGLQGKNSTCFVKPTLCKSM